MQKLTAMPPKKVSSVLLRSLYRAGSPHLSLHTAQPLLAGIAYPLCYVETPQRVKFD